MNLASQFSVVFVMAMASSGIGAAPPAVGAAGGGAETDAAVVLDDTTLWRHFHVSGPSHIRTADGKLSKAYIDWGARMREASQNEYLKLPQTFPRGEGGRGVPDLESPLPPADWASPAFDDGAWPRVWWPQPELPGKFNWNETATRARYPYHTVVVLARGRFELKDPAQVRSCTLSLDYWGGVVVYVNGREAARGHMPDNSTNLAAAAVDYPEEAFTTPNGKPLRIVEVDVLRGTDLGEAAARLALRDRKLRDVKIPAALLRQGVNVLTIEAHAAPVHVKASGGSGWPPIGLLSGRLTVSPASAALADRPRPRGIRVWNSAAYDTVTAFDYGDPSEPLRPIVIRAARNSVFSGRLMVGSNQPITGLKVSVADLVQTGGSAKLPSSAVRVRYALPAVEGKSWLAPNRFDGLLDAIPAEIPVIKAPPPTEEFYYLRVQRKALVSGAVAPLWYTVRVPREAQPGVYEGKVSVAAEGLPPTSVPLRVHVCDWMMPDPQDFRIQNFLYHAEEVEARHYEVPNYSDKHFELIGKSLALMTEVNSRQVQANLAVDFFANQEMRSNPESLVRWIKQPDGSYKHDFTIFDKYLDMVAKYVGKPRTLRLNCWGEFKTRDYCGNLPVSVLDPATGKIASMPQPALGTAESLAFWRPVFDEVLKRLKARGWLEETTLGYNIHFGVPTPAVVDVAHKLWPEGEWSWTSHAADEGGKFVGSFDGAGTDSGRGSKAWAVAVGRESVDTTKVVVMNVRHSDGVWMTGPSGKLPPLWTLEKPRRNTFCTTCRNVLDDNSPPREMRRLVELHAMSRGYDGVSEFGVDLFPLKRPLGGYYVPEAGRGTGWASQWTTLALLYPGPDGPVATERFEMFREGVELCEATLFIRQAMAEKKLSADLAQRADRYLHVRGERWDDFPGERDTAFDRGWFGARYMQSEEDAKLLDLAGEVAKELR